MVRKSPAKINVTSSVRITHFQYRRIYRLADLLAWLQVSMSEYREFELELHRGATGKSQMKYESPRWIGDHILVSGGDFIRAAHRLHPQSIMGGR